MRIKCPACSKTFQVPGEAAGKTHCPHCGQKLDLGRMERPDDLVRGDRLGGCRIEGLAGRGGMAAVYKATQLSLDRPVALKVLPRNLSADRQFVERFSREAAALALLSHPNIVSILDKGVENDTYYFVMEYVQGPSLRDRLRREGTLAPQDVLELMSGICAALEYAHEMGIVHRDLKPSNILLDSAGTPKLADFGIARILGSQTTAQRELTVAHAAMGSADYMAPEQREDAASVDHRADIYALGVILYQILTGHLPVGTFTPASKLNPDVPAALDRVIRKALASSPGDRFESVALFRAALNHALTTAAHSTARHRARPRSSRTAQVLLALGIVGAIAIFAGLVIAQRRRSHAVQPPPTKPPTAVRPPKPPTGTRPRPVKPPTRTAPVKPPKPKGESAAVKKALEPVRSYIIQNPNDYQGHLDRLREIIVQHNDIAVVQAAKKEREAIIQRLHTEIDEHFAQLVEQAEALAEKGDYGAAIRIFESFPEHLRTADALKRIAAAVEDTKAAAFVEFRKRQGQADKLAKAGKATEAAALLEPAKTWGLPDIAEAAGKQLAAHSAAVAAEARRIAVEQRELRVRLAGQLQALWAERRYDEALALVGPLLDHAPNAAARTALARYQRAAALLARFWKGVLAGAEASIGEKIRVNGGTWQIVELKDDKLMLSPDGVAKVGRSLANLDDELVVRLARAGLDTKKPDTQLMLALFHTYDKQADPAAARKAFETAKARGARPAEIEALRSLGVEEPPKDPAKPQEEPDAGFALSLNGTSSYVEVEDKRPLHLRAFTVEAWVWRRPGGATTQYVVAKNLGAAGALSYGIGIRDGAWLYATGFAADPEVRLTAATCTPGAWAHCALVCTGLERALFVNGKLVDTSRASQIWSVDDQPLTLGGKFGVETLGFFWSGAIDEVRISRIPRYRKDFTPERRLEADRQTVLLLRFDEGKGGIARDATKFRHHGAINGAQYVRPDALRLPPPPKKGPAPPPKPKTPKRGG